MIDLVVAHSGLIVSVLFFTMFSVIALWSYLPRNKQRLQSYAYIPLEDERDR